MDLELLKKAQGGDRVAVNRLAEANLGLLGKLARRFGRRYGLAFEEARSAGFDGLVRAVELYDPSKGFAFSTFAGRKILSAMLDHLKVECRYTRRFLTQPADPDWIDWSYESMSPPIFPSEIVENEEGMCRVRETFARWKMSPLMRRHAQVLELAFGIDPRGPLNYREIGEVMGISREWVRIHADRGLVRLCWAMGVAAPRGGLKRETSNR